MDDKRSLEQIGYEAYWTAHAGKSVARDIWPNEFASHRERWQRAAQAIKAAVLAEQVLAATPPPPTILAPHAGYRWNVRGGADWWHAEEVPEELEQQLHD